MHTTPTVSPSKIIDELQAMLLYGAYRVGQTRIRVAPKSGAQRLIVTVTTHIRTTVFDGNDATESNVFTDPVSAFNHIVAWAKGQNHG